MQKPHKNNFTLVKFYQQIILLDTIEKTLELIFTKKISAIAKIYYLLPKTHFKRKKNTSIKFTIHYLVEKTYIVQNKEKKVFVLMLNIINIFDNVSHPQLIRKL